MAKLANGGDATLLTKGALGVKTIAEDVLGRKAGEHLLPISSYAAALQVGTGTVQAALSHLREIGAAEFQPKGHLGTMLVSSDLPKLWRVARERPVLGLLPMPYSRLYEGLSTGIREVLRRSAVGVSFTHVNGSRVRLQTLLGDEQDFAIVSRLALELSLADGLPIKAAKMFGRGSFIREHVIYTRAGDDPIPKPGTVVGIDSQTLDQPYIARLLCADVPVTFSEVRYFDFESQLMEGNVDLIVWSGDDSMNIKSGTIQRSPLPARVTAELRGRNTEAVAVVRESDGPAFALLSQILDDRLIRRIQAQVVRGLRVASY